MGVFSLFCRQSGSKVVAKIFLILASNKALQIDANRLFLVSPGHLALSLQSHC